MKQDQQFIQLIDQHNRLLQKVCFLYADNAGDREDLYQDIVINAWQGYHRFRGEAKFSTWLYQVALNTAIIGFKRRQRLPIDAVPPENMPDVKDQEGDTIEDEQLTQLHKAISRLNEIEKAIVMLYLDGIPYEEMETIIGIVAGTLRVKMTRIKEKLRTLTKNEDYGIR